MTDAQAAAAAEVVRRFDALLETPVPPALLFDWAVSHPVPRYVGRALGWPVGLAQGCRDGWLLGCALGCPVGLAQGCREG